MFKTLLLAAVSTSFLITSCNSKSPKDQTKVDGEVEIVVPVEPLVRTEEDIISSLVYGGKEDILKLHTDARELVENYGNEVAQELSNSLWSGRVEYEQNRHASAAIAIAAYEQEPKVWSALRTGIAYVNGLGGDKDAEKAIKALSHELLESNAGAQYFLYKAYLLSGDSEMATNHLQNAAELGHPQAITILNND